MAVTLQDLAKFLINPLLPAFVFLLLLLLSKKHCRKGVFLFMLYLYLAAAPATSKLVMAQWRVADTVTNDKRYEAVAVLGGVADFDWYLRHGSMPAGEMFRYIEGYQHFGDSVDRLLMGAAVVKKGQAAKILVSDVVCKGVSETELVLAFLQGQGIEQNRIAVHGRVINTLGEAGSIKSYCEQHGIGRLLLITSASHMRRAAALFKKQGLAPDLLSVSRYPAVLEWDDYIPSAQGIDATKNMLYELVGYLSYRVRGDL
ncbi:MAG: YdcF family protein [Desulfobulbaceae bacterium]|nr:YdcF family protein [Desulfobulbaceae bacterium]HIJ79723.1 YdcF family protein [Deltaproteobacteria bacterium]